MAYIDDTSLLARDTTITYWWYLIACRRRYNRKTQPHTSLLAAKASTAEAVEAASQVVKSHELSPSASVLNVVVKIWKKGVLPKCHFNGGPECQCKAPRLHWAWRQFLERSIGFWLRWPCVSRRYWDLPNPVNHIYHMFGFQLLWNLEVIVVEIVCFPHCPRSRVARVLCCHLQKSPFNVD